LCGALLVFGALGCSDYLSGPGVGTNPNQPSSASRDQRLAAVQASMTTELTGSLARAACMWIQQCAGVDRQYATLEKYVTTEDDFNGEWQRVYDGGGLLDLRFIESDAGGAGDSVYVGVAKIIEAMDVGTAADLWGDIPYSDAVGSNPTPKFDSQQTVYAALQTLLDQAIVDLAGPGSGPGAVDLWYGGNKTKWTQLAHTLKARYYLHVAERDPSNYGRALAEGDLGIADSANDLKTHQSTSTTEWNVWYQFQVVQRSGYLDMGAALVNLMVARNDPRLPNYFAKDGGGLYQGARPGDGYSPATQSNLSATRLAQNYRQPLVTHAETMLIIAEAASQTGDSVTALDSLNAERLGAGLLPLSGIPARALLDSIMTEKYVVLFQNIEAWNDYKRECNPVLVPASGTEVIGRPLYGSSEANTNPNFPGEPATGRNWNDPNPCS
jgi:hypothetical protein